MVNDAEGVRVVDIRVLSPFEVEWISEMEHAATLFQTDTFLADNQPQMSCGPL